MAKNRVVGTVAFVVLLCVLFTGCKGEECTTSRSFNYNTYLYDFETTDCTYGCCGSFPYGYCCDSPTWLVWAIVGGVFAGISVLSLIIAGICCCLKQQGHKGQVVAPYPPHDAAYSFTTNNVAVTATSSQYPQYPNGPRPGPSFDAYPPPYSDPPMGRPLYMA
ncbi:uncharacterized protein LOC143284825 [Babylonia areolata]|uniref:uncharacterized protein LOC143284825 n=1 Tax=Babylonia areolata TaxID=304850 RepID=UPI003FD05570